MLILTFAVLFVGVSCLLGEHVEPDDGRDFFRLRHEHILRERIRLALHARDLSLEDYSI